MGLLLESIIEVILEVFNVTKEPIKMTKPWEPYVYGFAFFGMVVAATLGITFLFDQRYIIGAILIASSAIVLVILLLVYKRIHKN